MTQIIYPNRGGTGTNIKPAQGSILYSTDGEKYTPLLLSDLLALFIVISATPPSNPAINQLWIDTS